MKECATLFLEKNLDKEVRYAFASLFVELLIPVAATAKREYGIPAVKKFVDMLYKDALDLARKAKHSSVSLIHGVFFSNFDYCGLYSIVVRRTAHNLMVVGSMPASIEVSTLGQGDYTNCASLSIQEYKWVPGR